MSLIKCIECGGTISSTAQTCPHCGAPIILCRACGHPMPARAETCPQCGAPAETVYEEVKQSATVPAPPTPAGPAYGYVPMPQQPLPPAKRGSRGLMVTGIVLLVLIFCCIVLFATCPDQKKHADIVSQRVAEAVEEMRDSMGVTNGLSIIDGVVDRVTRYAVSHQLRVDNYRLFSVGRFKTGEDKEETITFGVANHVFCFFTKEDLKREVRKWKTEKQKDASSILGDLWDNIRESIGINDLLPDLFGSDGDAPEADDDIVPNV